MASYAPRDWLWGEQWFGKFGLEGCDVPVSSRWGSSGDASSGEYDGASLPATQAVADVPLLRRGPEDALADFMNQRPALPA